ncbi:MAG: acyl carrier protein [Omnitrophica bacterium]|nr:acyl carrier protein [Candidatus Omnitrophota bacterium]
MDRAENDIKKRLNRVFRETFGDEKLEVFETMTAVDIDAWDSLMHVVLVVAIEKEFGITLNAAEVGKLENVGMMLTTIKKHTRK